MNQHKALEAIAQLRALEAKRATLTDELERSLLLINLWPEVFACGPVKSHIEGSPRRWRFVVVRGDGVRLEWPLDDVPEKLHKAGPPA